MNLLLTNDDGYQSGGLKILAEKLAEKHNVYVVAPSSNRSAVSHHISMYSTNELVSVGDRWWSCSGYPADCAAIGLNSDLLGTKIDAVIAGINYGPNLGTDIIYSGTCGAARQAVLNNIPGIAVSLDPLDWEKANKEGFKFDALAKFIADNLETLISLTKLNPPRMFVNVNGGSLDKYKGVKFTNELCIRQYNDYLEFEKDGDVLKSIFHAGGSETLCGDNGDFKVCHDGYISVSRVYVDPVCSDMVDGIKFSL